MNAATHPANTKPVTFRATYAGYCAVTRRRIAPGDLIHKNPNGRGYVLVEAKSAPRFQMPKTPGPVYSHTAATTPTPTPVPVPEVADIAALEHMYRTMDWTYDYSDDASVHRRGDAAAARIKRMEAACVATGLATAEELQARRRVHVARAFGEPVNL